MVLIAPKGHPSWRLVQDQLHRLGRRRATVFPAFVDGCWTLQVLNGRRRAFRIAAKNRLRTTKVLALSIVAVLTAAAAKAASNSDAGFDAKLGEIRSSVLAQAQSAQSIYSLHFKGNCWVCADMGGKEGYNHVGIRKLFASPNCGGECADLSKVAILRWTNLRGACLRGVYLSGAYLHGTYLREADLSWADLSGADLIGADLIRAHLIGADLRGANLRGTNLSEANLSWADLNGADLRGADLSWARYNAETRLPIDDDEAKERGMVKQE